MFQERPKRFSRRRFLGPILGIAFAAALLIGADAALRPWLRPTGVYAWGLKRTSEGGFRVDADPILGWKPEADSVSSKIEKLDGKIVASATYSIDRYSRRITPGQKYGRRARPLLFFGCSFTFGQGVNDDQTLPYYVAQLAPDYRVYNYGFEGYGTQNMLARLKETDIGSEIGEKGKPVAVYVFIEDHVRRAIGQMSWTGAGAGTELLPYYFARGGAEDLARQGSFKTGRPFATALFKLFAKSSLVRHFNIDYPPRATDADIGLVARMIEESRESFKAKFGSDEFYVLFFPENYGDYVARLIPFLKAAGVRYLDYHKLDLAKEVRGEVELGNGHPTPRSYQVVAGRIAGVLAANDHP